MEDQFRKFFAEARPIKLREPLAETLGAFEGDGNVVEYTYSDAVKMAGHACPTVTGAYLACQAALDALYPGEIPVRGEIAVTVHGEADEGVFGVMGQVFTYITGAAPLTGFRGLGPKFKRKDLLKYSSDKPDPAAAVFEFKRLDNGRSVTVRFLPWEIPFPEEKAKRLGEVMEKVLWEAAKGPEARELKDLWIEKVRGMIIDRNGIDRWLKVTVNP